MLVKKNALSRIGLPTRIRKPLRDFLQRSLAAIAALALVLAPAAPGLNAAPAPAKTPAPLSDDGDNGGGCRLNSAHGDIQHVIVIQFDNVHFRRDNPNVPSDVEQMPNLYNFLVGNGTVLDNHYTPLISHTADDIITTMTGVYGDRHGQPVANDFDYFSTPANPRFTSSFEYWTDKINNAGDPSYYMITPEGKNAPAPWVAWTRAGCNFGAVSTANIELENVFGDISTVFASDPTQLAIAQNEVNTNFDGAVADYEGVAIHCAKGSDVCSQANHGEPDLLPDEPGGYNGFKALYGHKFVKPVISPGSGPMVDLDDNPIEDTDNPPNLGFPGFDPTAAQTLSYVAAMQEHGIPVTTAYIADAHDNHDFDWNSAIVPAACVADPEQGGLGPGDSCYEAQLAAYDEAFGKFFARLEKDGITKNNTLFIITADENDHFAGGAPFNQGCDGVKVQCVYTNADGSQTVIGEFTTNMTGLMATEPTPPVTTGFDITFDMAPSFYVDGEPAAGAALARQFEKAAAGLTAVNPRTGNTDKLMTAMADPVELKLLHMITGDPRRDPTFTFFGDPDYFFVTGDPNCNSACVFQNSGNSWNHGGIQQEIVRTWLGIVGPGVKNEGVNDDMWSDHTDIRPTMLVLTGLKDDYQHEGRALTEVIEPWALPSSLSGASGRNFVELAEAFKQINAPNAALGRKSLRISTEALTGSDSTYSNLESKLAAVTSTRDGLGGQMLQLLEDAEFNNTNVSASATQTLVNQAKQLLNYVEELGGE
jgi:hypothetical protein